MSTTSDHRPGASPTELSELTRQTYRTARRFVVGLVGVTVVAVGVVFLLLPGPGILIVLAGLSVLATEFALARLWLRRLRLQLRRLEAEARRLLEEDQSGAP